MSTETTAPTTQPPIEIDGPAEVGNPEVTRGTQVVVLPTDLPEGMCFVPADRLSEFPLVNYVACADLELQVAVAEAPVPAPVTELPETGGEMFMLIIAFALVGLGAAIRRLA